MGPPEPRGHLGPPKEAVKGAGEGGGFNSRNEEGVVNRVLHTWHALHTFFEGKG